MTRPRGTNKTLMGIRFGRLLVQGRAEDRDSDSKPRVRWLCVCDCGNIVADVRGDALESGKTTSCGCWHAEAIGHRASVHGGARRSLKDPEYVAWHNMRQRCKPTYKQSADYFDRGITVFPGWDKTDGYEDFLAHVGRRPSSEHSLDRIENDEGYWPGNVRWTTWDVQLANRRAWAGVDGIESMAREIRRLRQIIENAGLGW